MKLQFLKCFYLYFATIERAIIFACWDIIQKAGKMWWGLVGSKETPTLDTIGIISALSFVETIHLVHAVCVLYKICTRNKPFYGNCKP